MINVEDLKHIFDGRTKKAHDELHDMIEVTIKNMVDVCQKHNVSLEISIPLITHIFEDSIQVINQAHKDLKGSGIREAMQNSIKLPDITCKCGKTLDHAMQANGKKATPGEGDFTLCAHCGQVFIFTSPTTVREATQDDLHKLKEEDLQLLAKAQDVIKGFRRK